MSELQCASAREQLLEAELDELRGIGGSPLARHIASCHACRVYARRIISGYEMLDRGLQEMAPARKRAWLRWAPLPLAAAAVLALLLTRATDQPVPENRLLIRSLTAAQPVVTPPHGRQAMVIQNKDMTVVWLY